jgi:2-oxoglutarate dehydrogenase E2 component (dihydrolipoamide succinyltransferase)
MSEFKIVMPKLGESIQEATITKWFVNEGDKVAEDDNLFEVATDKVDSEIPSPVDGTIIKILHTEGTLLPVGELVAIIDTMEGDVTEELKVDVDNLDLLPQQSSVHVSQFDFKSDKNRFYSPLVKNIAQKENISYNELEMVKGSGINGRVQKKDILNYLENRNSVSKPTISTVNQPTVLKQPVVSIGEYDQIVEMDRVRKLIANHMVMSKQVSAHVTTVVEADVTNLVLWREKNKDIFQQKYGGKLTYIHIFTEATAQAITEFPLLNSSVDGDKIIIKKNINIGIAVAKPDGNLIVPIVRDAWQKNLVGLVLEINRLADAARTNKLLPDEIQGGTFTITNFGSFRNIIGTPIINQPQVAILATGSIEKKPAVLETPTGDVIAIRHKMYLSLSYDHRIIDGALGGSFLRRVADILEQFSLDRTI